MTNSPLSPQAAAAELLARRRARSSLIGFCEYLFPNYQAAWHHRRIAERLEAVARGECKRLIIAMPPRHGKSQLASRGFPS
ncbi:MAG: terminase, partial [Armatimonadia bacterium]